MLDLVRIALASPWLIVGQHATTIGFRIAGASHLNPHRRSSS